MTDDPLGDALLDNFRVYENLATKERRPIVDPLISRLKKATASRFRAQYKQAKDTLASSLEKYFDEDGPTQEEPPASTSHAISESLAVLVATRAFSKAFDSSTGKAYAAGSKEVEDRLDVVNPSKYADDAATMAAELDKTTHDRLTEVIATVFKDEGDFDDLLTAIDMVFEDAIDMRAEMVAVTEISNAWNSGAVDAAQEAIDGGSEIEKAWITEDDPCPECEANADEDFIPFEEQFSTGDDQPPAHPNCQCSLELRTAKA